MHQQLIQTFLRSIHTFPLIVRDMYACMFHLKNTEPFIFRSVPFICEGFLLRIACNIYMVLNTASVATTKKCIGSYYTSPAIFPNRTLKFPWFPKLHLLLCTSVSLCKTQLLGCHLDLVKGVPAE